MKRILFSHREKLAYFLLVLLIVAGLAYRFYDFYRLIRLVEEETVVEILNGLPVSESRDIRPETASGDRTPVWKKKEEKTWLFPFDPNTITEEQLDHLAMDKFVKRNLLKYRSSGGRFYKKEHIKRLYGMSEQQYTILEPYIDLPEPVYSERATGQKTDSLYRTGIKGFRETAEKISVPVNRGSESDFERIRGIGPVLSDRIVQYREKLGGFTSVDQLSEVYGVGDSLYREIRDELRFDSVELRKIGLNRVTFKELLKHPYVDYEMTKSLINYREQHGNYNGPDDFKSIYRLDQSSLERLLPYLDYSTGKEDSAPGAAADSLR
jgi:competence ComEA-like helix-hairpin-helix protein